MILKYLIGYSFSKVLTSLLNVFSLVLLIKGTSLKEYGLLSLVLSVASIISTLVFSWLSKSILRFRSIAIQSLGYKNFHSFILLILLINSGVLWGMYNVVSESKYFAAYFKQIVERHVYYVPVIFAISYGIREVSLEYSRISLNVGKFLLLNLINSICMFVFSVFLYLKIIEFQVFFRIYPIILLLINFFLFLTVLGFNISLKVIFDIALFKQFLKFGFPLSINVFLNQTLFLGPRVIIGYLLGLEDLGIFSKVYDIIQRVMTTLMLIIYNTFYPLLQKEWDDGSIANFYHLYYLNLFTYLVVGFSTVLLIAFNSKYIYFIDEKLILYSPLAVVVAFSVFVNRFRLGNISIYFLLDKSTFLYVLLSLLYAIILNISNAVFTLNFGLLGAFFSILIGYILITIIEIYTLSKMGILNFIYLLRNFLLKYRKNLLKVLIFLLIYIISRLLYVQFNQSMIYSVDIIFVIIITFYIKKILSHEEVNGTSKT